jgi:hypothetical protein
MGRLLSNGLREPDKTKPGYSGRDFVETLTGVKKSEGWEAGAGCEGGAHWAAKSADFQAILRRKILFYCGYFKMIRLVATSIPRIEDINHHMEIPQKLPIIITPFASCNIPGTIKYLPKPSRLSPEENLYVAMLI